MLIMKSIYFSLLIATCLILGSCKDFLDIEPRSSVSDETTIIDQVSAQTALNGVYNALGASGYYAVSFPMIGYTSGDNVVYIGTLRYNGQFSQHNVLADNQTILNFWRAAYKTINQANHVIEKVAALSSEVIPDEEKARITGEAYFVRALAYFDVVRVYGTVPIVLTPTGSASDKAGIRRSPAAEVYDQVLDDLTRAESLLPDNVNRVRATKKTAQALLSRYYLYQGNWEKTIEYASEIISDQANYELVYPYSAWFANDVVQTRESIFEIAYSILFLNNNRGDWQPATRGGGRRIVPTDEYIALANDPTTGGGRKDLLEITPAGWHGNLYYRSPATDPSYILRVAEIYLNRAEAYAHLDGSTNITLALADLNAVRNRADLPDLSLLTKEDVLLAIENERRLEFGLEPHRWFDLVRTGRAQEVLKITDVNKLLLPVPIEEIIIDNALEPQNPGY